MLIPVTSQEFMLHMYIRMFLNSSYFFVYFSSFFLFFSSSALKYSAQLCQWLGLLLSQLWQKYSFSDKFQEAQDGTNDEGCSNEICSHVPRGHGDAVVSSQGVLSGEDPLVGMSIGCLQVL
jgi:hypothetical protein